MTTKLILIRHGQTEWNLLKRYCGFVDLELNKNGKIQAGKLHKKMKKHRVHKVYSSDRKRAVQTAGIVFKKQRIEMMPDLREIHFGVFEGLNHAEILKKYPEIYKKWLKDPYSVTIPKGEGLAKFKKRVVRAIKGIVKENLGKTVAVVCHGGAISIFINHLLKSKDFWSQIPKSTAMSIVEFEKNKATIKVFNDISHLGTVLK